MPALDQLVVRHVARPAWPTQARQDEPEPDYVPPPGKPRPAPVKKPPEPDAPTPIDDPRPTKPVRKTALG